jgi:hypothetical protein
LYGICSLLLFLWAALYLGVPHTADYVTGWSIPRGILSVLGIFSGVWGTYLLGFNSFANWMELVFAESMLPLFPLLALDGLIRITWATEPGPLVWEVFTRTLLVDLFAAAGILWIAKLRLLRQTGGLVVADATREKWRRLVLLVVGLALMSWVAYILVQWKYEVEAGPQVIKNVMNSIAHPHADLEARRNRAWDLDAIITILLFLAGSGLALKEAASHRKPREDDLMGFPEDAASLLRHDARI